MMATGTAWAYTGTLQHRLSENVKATHRLEDAMHLARTPFGYHKATPYSVAQWRSHRLLQQGRMVSPQYAYRWIWPVSSWTTLRCVIGRESGWVATAHNPSGASGLTQLMPFWWNGESAYGWVFNPYNAVQNLHYAYLLWLHTGWSSWGGANSCGIP